MIHRAAAAFAALALIQDPTPREGRQPIRAGPAAQTVPEPEPRDFEYRHQIFFGVLEGLYVDGVPNEVVDAVTVLDEQTSWPANFVYACPVCMPAFDAFKTYRARPKFLGDKAQRDTFGRGLGEDATRRLLGADLLVRQQAVRELVLTWMRRRMESLRLTPRERARWEETMRAFRKKGMAYLEGYREQGLGSTYSWMKECPFCEAANGACEPR